jgi:glycerophosphoryl diester phosphodiesterase
MDGILKWGVEVILWAQQFSPKWDLFFKIFTSFGSEIFFMLLLPLVYWCLNRGEGARLAILLLITSYINAVAKALAAQPRPFLYDARVQQLYPAGGGGFPSGHTQIAVAVWGYLAVRFRRGWLWGIAALMMFLIPLSRVYLGVHFPTDLLGGYVIGTIVLLLYLWLAPPIEKWLIRRGTAWQLGAALALPAMLMVGYGAGEKYVITTVSTLMGMGVGFVLERRWIGFDSGGTLERRGLRFLLGIAILFGFQYGLKAGLSGLWPEPLLRFVRYLLSGLLVAVGAPWLFLGLGLVETRGKASK